MNDKEKQRARLWELLGKLPERSEEVVWEEICTEEYRTYTLACEFGCGVKSDRSTVIGGLQDVKISGIDVLSIRPNRTPQKTTTFCGHLPDEL